MLPTLTTWPAPMPYGRGKTEVEFEAGKHILLAINVKHPVEPFRQVLIGQTDERPEFLVKLIVARLADFAQDGLAHFQPLLLIVVTVIHRDKSLLGNKAVDFHLIVGSDYLC